MACTTSTTWASSSAWTSARAPTTGTASPRPADAKVFDKQLTNSETKLRAVLDKRAATFDTVLVIVAQPASVAALPLTVARDTGCKVVHLPGLSMRRIADLYPGEPKTDAKKAAVITDAARTMPHALRSLELTDEITAELPVLVSFDQDLAARRPAPPTGYAACSPSSIAASASKAKWHADEAGDIAFEVTQGTASRGSGAHDLSLGRRGQRDAPQGKDCC